MNREPEKAALEAFAKIMARKRGGRWVPVDPKRAAQLKARLKRNRK